MGKAKTESSARRSRHDPLTIQLREDERGSGKLSAPGKRAAKRNHDDANEKVRRCDALCTDKAADPAETRAQSALDAKTSKRVLDLARRQQEEELDGSDGEDDDEDRPEWVLSAS